MLQRFCVACICGVVSSVPIESHAGNSFIRGDVDGNGQLVRSDAVQMLHYLFTWSHWPQPMPCLDAADADDNGKLNVIDAVYVLLHLFAGGAPPPPPFTWCGPDPTDDSLGCASFDFCRPARSFYDQPIEEDGVFFVVDLSGSMQDSGELSFAIYEILRFSYTMNPDTEFGAVFFDQSLVQFPAGAKPASARDEASVTAFRSFLESVRGGSGSCPQPAVLAAIAFAQASASQKKRILYVSDGGAFCHDINVVAYEEAMLDAVKSANNGSAVIDTIGVLYAESIFVQFLIDLAAMNGGTYTRVED